MYNRNLVCLSFSFSTDNIKIFLVTFRPALHNLSVISIDRKDNTCSKFQRISLPNHKISLVFFDVQTEDLFDISRNQIHSRLVRQACEFGCPAGLYGQVVNSRFALW